jgi:hypothetical protein
MATSPPDDRGEHLGEDRAEDRGPSLREITRQLTTPALAGYVLTRERIGQLAAGLGLPAGLAERSQMLVNAIQAAAEMERRPLLLDALSAETDRWEAIYRGWSRLYPASAPIWTDWRARLTTSRALLAEMRSTLEGVVAVEAPGPETPPRSADLETPYDD